MQLKLPENLKFSLLDGKPDLAGLKSLLQPGARRLLVLYSDGFSLSGAVLEQGQTLSLQACVHSSQWKKAPALQEVCEQLLQQTGKLPSEAIMVHAQMAQALLELPVAADAGMDAERIGEMVRWEMEGVYADSVARLDIGWVLMGRGMISDEQRGEVLQLLRENRQGVETGMTTPLRFGDIAIGEGYISSQQLEEALAIQDELQLVDQRVICGWQPQPEGLWLCSAMAAAEHDQWLEAFQAQRGNGLPRQARLTAFYPLAGASAGLADNAGEPFSLLELHPACVVTGTIRNRAWQHFGVRRIANHCLAGKALVDFVSSQQSDGPCFVSGCHPRYEDLSGACLEALPRPWTQLVTPANGQANALLTALAGAASLHLQPETTLLQAVPGMGPPLPFYRQRHGQIAMAAVLAVIAVAGVEYYFRHSVEAARLELTGLEQQLRQREKLNRSQQKMSRDRERYNREVDVLQQDHDNLVRRKELIERVLVRRQTFTEQLLPMIASTINEWVVINSIEETDWYSFRLAGQAVDQGAIDRFNQSLSQSLGEWQMYISESPSSVTDSGTYRFSFTISRRPSAAAAGSKAS